MSTRARAKGNVAALHGFLLAASILKLSQISPCEAWLSNSEVWDGLLMEDQPAANFGKNLHQTKLVLKMNLFFPPEGWNDELCTVPQFEVSPGENAIDGGEPISTRQLHRHRHVQTLAETKLVSTETDGSNSNDNNNNNNNNKVKLKSISRSVVVGSMDGTSRKDDMDGNAYASIPQDTDGENTIVFQKEINDALENMSIDAESSLASSNDIQPTTPSPPANIETVKGAGRQIIQSTEKSPWGGFQTNESDDSGTNDEEDEEDEDDLEWIGMDLEQIREVDESISILTGSGSLLGRKEIMKDIEILPSESDATTTASSYPSTIPPASERSTMDLPLPLPLSDDRHNARIELDMRRLAVSIASGIENEDEWKAFGQDGGGILPLLECVRDGARDIRDGTGGWNGSFQDRARRMRSRSRSRFRSRARARIRARARLGGNRRNRNPNPNSNHPNGSIHGLVGEREREAAFDTACNACKTLRDLSVLSKPFSAIVTDGILRADAFWSESRTAKDGEEIVYGGVISDLVLLLKYSAEMDQMYSLGVKRNSSSSSRGVQTEDGNVQSTGRRRKRRDVRQRYALYVVQLLLAMACASDKAVDRLRATEGLTDAVLSCSSYAQKERLRRRWIKYPIELFRRKFRKSEVEDESNEDPFLTAASVADGIPGQIQGVSNQLLAALGYNEWYPKTAGQKGLRILCLDGGGARGVTAISSMRSIVDALGGIEVCDAFDMIAGTSTGAIIAFLVGLRRESSLMARKRYEKLIKQVFIKSALSTPMLLFTTATYDESPFNEVMMGVLGDNSMLASRADPRVPLVFAISSKMSSTPTQLCLFRNYNYKRGEMSDAFVEDPIEAKVQLELPLQDDIYQLCSKKSYDENLHQRSEKSSLGSRHPGSFRVLQRAALRATTAAPTVFKPVLMGNELYCDGGIVASNPAAVAIHEARTIFPNVPIEMVVSCGTGAFVEEKSEPRIGWDGIIGQIVNSATDGEQTHHILEDILGQGSTAHLGKSLVSKTKYYRFNPVIGTADAFPIDETSAVKLEELSKITTAYMKEPEQKAKLDEIASILKSKSRWRRIFDP